MNNDTFLFAVADRKDTGLPYDLAIRIGNGNNNEPPQIGIWTGKEIIPVSISDEPEVISQEKVTDFEPVREFVIRNKEILLKHWNGELTDRQTLNLLKEASEPTSDGDNKA